MSDHPESLEQQFRRMASLVDRGQPKAPPERKRRAAAPRAANQPVRRTRKEAEEAILIAWREWVKTHVAEGKVGDGDVHSFLRHIKADAPDLLAFPSKITPYETAFRWIVSDQAGLEPLGHRRP